ncbi:SF3a splicing factor complex subunit [Yamadazyma tenuis]
MTGDGIPEDITVPPPDVRAVIDKTAEYVLKNGDSFETRLKANADSTTKFPFMFSTDAHYPYYQWKLGRHQVETKTPASTTSTKKLPEPPPLEFLSELPTVSPYDLTIIKLTALFVAHNGDKYQQELSHHQISRGNKAQFEFMNTSHSLYPVFQVFLHQYKRTIEVLLQNSSFVPLLPDSYHRAKHSKLNQVQHDTQKKERLARQTRYASVDWQDFTIVGKIEFDDIDKVTELAMPLKREDLIYRSLEAKAKAIEMPPVAVPATAGPDPELEAVSTVPKGMKVKSAGESRLKRKDKEPTIKCPITGKAIAESAFDEHIRILLRDPNYEQQKKNYIDKNFRYGSNLTNDEVYQNIKRLSRKRGSAPVPGTTVKRVGPSDK